MRSYVVPAAFILILQQTLLMGVGDARRRRPSSRAARRPSPAAALRGRPRPGARASLLRACPGCALFLIVLPRVYGFSTLRPARAISSLLAVPFILSVSFLGQFVSAWFKRRETAVLLFIAISLPLFFLVGVSWPVEAIPDPPHGKPRSFPARRRSTAWCASIRWARRFTMCRRDWTRLWILTVVYGALAIVAARISIRAGGAPMHLRRWAIAFSGACRRWRSEAARSLPVSLRGPAHGRPPLPGMVRQTEIRIAPEITGRLASLAVDVRASRCTRATLAGAARQSRARRRRSGKPRRRLRSAKADATGSMPACAKRKSPSPAQSVETAEANLVAGRAAECRAGCRARRPRTSPAASNSTRARPRWPRRRPISTSSARSTPPQVPARPPRSARWQTRGRACRGDGGRPAGSSSTRRRSMRPVDGVVGILVAELGEIDARRASRS